MHQLNIMDKNYLQLHTYAPFSFLYIFIDTVDHFYERIMNSSGITLKGIKEYIKDESPFRLISCYVRKKDAFIFCNAIQQIRNRALLLGYREYDEMCQQMQQSDRYLRSLKKGI